MAKKEDSGVFPMLKRMFSKPSEAIRKIQKKEEPFERGEGSERYQAFQKALKKRDDEEQQESDLYDELNRKAKERALRKMLGK